MPERKRYGKASSPSIMNTDSKRSKPTNRVINPKYSGDDKIDMAKSVSDSRKERARAMGPQAAAAQDASARQDKYATQKADEAAQKAGLTKAERDKALEKMSVGGTTAEAARAVEKAALDKAKFQENYKKRRPSGSGRGGSGASSSRSEAVKKGWQTRRRGRGSP